jgi:hypothetical protein
MTSTTLHPRAARFVLEARLRGRLVEAVAVAAGDRVDVFGVAVDVATDHIVAAGKRSIGGFVEAGLLVIALRPAPAGLVVPPSPARFFAKMGVVAIVVVVAVFAAAHRVAPAPKIDIIHDPPVQPVIVKPTQWR